MILCYENISPRVSSAAFLADTANIIGKVIVGKDSSIWFNAVLRGDTDQITIGESTNIQDCTVVHAEDGIPTTIGNGVTVGHSCIIHGSTIGDNSLIGMGSIVMDGCKIGENTIVAAGSLLSKGKEFPSGVLVMGSPAKVVRELSLEEIEGIKASAQGYVAKSKKYIK